MSLRYATDRGTNVGGPAIQTLDRTPAATEPATTEAPRDRRFHILVIVVAALSLLLVGPVLDRGAPAEGGSLQDASGRVESPSAVAQLASLRAAIDAADEADQIAAEAQWGEGDAVLAAELACTTLSAVDRSGLSEHEAVELDEMVAWICAAPAVGPEEHALLRGFAYYLRAGQGR